jgi:5-formyltetrahydrofolate cyclo-ligase
MAALGRTLPARSMTEPLARTKQDWRLEIRRRLRARNPADRGTDSARIHERLVALPEWAGASTVLLFHPLRSEPDTLPLLQRALAESRTVALPAMDSQTGDYLPRQVISATTQLVAGPLGILEPPASAPALPWNQLDFLVIPGLGFCPDGRRLGRGRGYYDRLLARTHGFCCGVAFDEQIVADLPTEPHDRRLDCILTPSRGWRCSAART